MLDGIGPVVEWAAFLAGIARGVHTVPELVWTDSPTLQRLGVEPWAGPGSLPVWLPPEEYAGMLAHDPSPAAAAGLTCRPLADTARDTLTWVRAVEGAPVSGFTLEEEQALLARLGG